MVALAEDMLAVLSGTWFHSWVNERTDCPTGKKKAVDGPSDYLLPRRASMSAISRSTLACTSLSIATSCSSSEEEDDGVGVEGACVDPVAELVLLLFSDLAFAFALELASRVATRSFRMASRSSRLAAWSRAI